MENYYNHETFLLFLGGVFSLILTVIIIFAKQEYKRGIKRAELETQKKIQPEAVGDIETKLNDSYEYRKINFLELLALWGLQPLFIISFINLFYQPSTLEIILAFSLVVFTILHEFWSGIKYSSNGFYQTILVFFWIGLFLLISYRTNKVEALKNQKPIENVKPSSDSLSRK
ncbi:MAG: hypothetical protein ACXVNM_01180 [Bacteroidia bacterium]